MSEPDSEAIYKYTLAASKQGDSAPSGRAVVTVKVPAGIVVQ